MHLEDTAWTEIAANNKMFYSLVDSIQSFTALWIPDRQMSQNAIAWI